MLRGMWDLPGPGIEPVSPALAGGFLTTAPPGKSLSYLLFIVHLFLPACELRTGGGLFPFVHCYVYIPSS